MMCPTRLSPNSAKGAYAKNDHPPAFDTWMENVKDEIYDAIERGADPLPKAVKAWDLLDSGETAASTIVVDKLIQTTWSQGGKKDFLLPWFPSYDYYCPAETDWLGSYRVAPTGCVATAMAQVMKYWSWPPSGKGSHSYDPWWPCETQWGVACHGYGVRSVTFSFQEYAWQSMPNAVAARASGAHTWGEQQVQLLMRDLGVAVDMDYHPINGSGAYLNLNSFPAICDPANNSDCGYYAEWDSSALYALENYFRYDTSAHYEYKSSHGNNWYTMLENELDNGRPLLYRGSGSGGHAFVCDGYDSNQMYHFNWGWGGSYDGWYNLGALTPGTQNFTNAQAAIFNLKPATPELVVTRFTVDPARPGPGQSLNIQVTVTNRGPEDATTDFSIDWYAHRTSAPVAEIGDASGTLYYLNAGDSAVVNLTYAGYSSEGVMNMYAQVDTSDSISESNEGNNLAGPQGITIVGFCECDLDEDGNVDEADLAALSAGFGRTNCSGSLPCQGDSDNDDDQDGTDLVNFAINYWEEFGRSDCPPDPS